MPGVIPGKDDFRLSDHRSCVFDGVHKMKVGLAADRVERLETPKAGAGQYNNVLFFHMVLSVSS